MSDQRETVAQETETSQESIISGSYRGLTLGVALSVSLVAFETLGVATVLPNIAHELGGLDSYGWAISAIMLANIFGTVTAGHFTDRVGLRRPMVIGLLIFAVGCSIAAVAPSWPIFLLGRVTQGLGVGAVMSTAFATIGKTYPERLRAAMFALVSSAWTIPSLVGPVAAGLLADNVTWRAVFILILPLALLAVALASRRLPAQGTPPEDDTTPARSWWTNTLINALVLVVGTTLLLQALLLSQLAILIPMAIVGIATAFFGLWHVTPRGTLTVQSGIGAGIVTRALLCGAFFGSEAYLPLGFQQLRGLNASEGGIGLAAGALTWVAGSAVQAKLDAKLSQRRTGSTTIGCFLMAIGVAVLAGSIVTTAVPVWIGILGWAIAGLGMGVGFNASTTETVEHTPASRQGEVNSSLQLAQTLSTAVLAGLGSSFISFFGQLGAGSRPAFVLQFVLCVTLAVLGVVTARRLRPR